MKRTTLTRVRVRPLIGDPRRGHVIAGGTVLACALGRSGIGVSKREGDGRTPRGAFRLRGGYFRPDRPGARPRTSLPFAPVQPHHGWCDDPGHPRYNRPLSLPAKGVSAEQMWREDALYDLLIDLDYNRGPIRKGRGSAIFLHCARPGYAPTEGCVALERTDLRRLLARLGPRTRLIV